ncbi:single-stranded DNA-binding protein, partial [Paenibacillus larvae]|nr:single-stranded DNA-binding protein [Paenibacillus larvae]MDT2182735.1 single-stranded DNA-binding protein [Paenibacillus larvae]MDT2198912.1 single-stranded DNA-binding protein [Paenibacillus larvae]MDT2207737.1 single-stranded DNA-binding protein [Paenibacillus larvae]
RNYENNEGRRIYVTEVVADNVRFLESSKNENKRPEDPFYDSSTPLDISDDELPF